MLSVKYKNNDLACAKSASTEINVENNWRQFDGEYEGPPFLKIPILAHYIETSVRRRLR